MEWFQKELATTHVNEEKTGWMSLRLTFERNRRFRICNKAFVLRGITFHGLRVKETKRKWTQFGGDALFDWGKSQMTIPPKGQVYTEGMRTDFSDWEDYSGEIPPSTGILDARITAHMIHFDPKASVIDLSVL